MAAINITGIQEYAAERDTTLRGLPYLMLQEELVAAGISLTRHTTKQTITELQRKGGISRPYTMDPTDKAGKITSELMKIAELPIDPVLVYFQAKDNIQNYSTPVLAVGYGKQPDAKTFKHPWESEIQKVVRQTLPEDMLLGVYHGVRSNAGNTALSSYNGLFQQEANLITAGSISAVKGNLIATDALTEVGVETKAYDVAKEFLSALPLLMRRGEFFFKMSLDAASKIITACEAKYPYSGPVTLAIVEDRLRQAAMCPKMKLVPTALVGTGDYLEASVAGATEVSFAPDGAPFLNVRNINEDPNIVDFWAQYYAASRINTISPKKFVCNDKTNSMPTSAFGDY